MQIHKYIFDLQHRSKTSQMNRTETSSGGTWKQEDLRREERGGGRGEEGEREGGRRRKERKGVDDSKEDLYHYCIYGVCSILFS